jgi:hypothetical protein
LISSIKKTYGIGTRQIERYMRKAADALVEVIDIPREEHIAIVHEELLETIKAARADGDHKAAIRGYEALISMLGLRAPTVVHSENLNVNVDATKAMEEERSA